MVGEREPIPGLKFSEEFDPSARWRPLTDAEREINASWKKSLGFSLYGLGLTRGDVTRVLFNPFQTPEQRFDFESLVLDGDIKFPGAAHLADLAQLGPQGGSREITEHLGGVKKARECIKEYVEAIKTYRVILERMTFAPLGY